MAAAFGPERKHMTTPAEHEASAGTHPPPAQDANLRAATATTAAGLRTAEDDGREIRLLQSLSRAARDMHRSLSLDEVVRVATERARELVGAREAAMHHAVDADWSRAHAASVPGVSVGGDDGPA